MKWNNEYRSLELSLFSDMINNKIDIDIIISDHIAKIVAGYIYDNSGKYILTDKKNNMTYITMTDKQIDEAVPDLYKLVIASMSETMMSVIYCFYDPDCIESVINRYIIINIGKLLGSSANNLMK